METLRPFCITISIIIHYDSDIDLINQMIKRIHWHHLLNLVHEISDRFSMSLRRLTLLTLSTFSILWSTTLTLLECFVLESTMTKCPSSFVSFPTFWSSHCCLMSFLRYAISNCDAFYHGFIDYLLNFYSLREYIFYKRNQGWTCDWK